MTKTIKKIALSFLCVATLAIAGCGGVDYEKGAKELLTASWDSLKVGYNKYSTGTKVTTAAELETLATSNKRNVQASESQIADLKLKATEGVVFADVTYTTDNEAVLKYVAGSDGKITVTLVRPEAEVVVKLTVKMELTANDNPYSISNTLNLTIDKAVEVDDALVFDGTNQSYNDFIGGVNLKNGEYLGANNTAVTKDDPTKFALVTFKGIDIVAKLNDGATVFGYIGDDFVMFHSFGNLLEVGKKYDVSAPMTAYFSGYQLTGGLGTKDVTPLGNATKKLTDITPEAKNSVTEYITEKTFNHGEAYGGYVLEYIKVTAQIIGTSLTNYTTGIADAANNSASATSDKWGTNRNNVLMVYYHSNLGVLRSLPQKTDLELNLLSYAWRDNNEALAVAYLGDGSELASTDADIVAVDKNGLNTIASKYIEDAVVDLPATGTLGSTITWDETTDANNAIAIADGKLTVTVTPDVIHTAVVTATITKGAVSDTKVFNIEIGDKISTIAEVLTVTATSGSNAVYYKTIGKVTNLTHRYNAGSYSSTDMWIEDANGDALMLYSVPLPQAMQPLGNKPLVKGNVVQVGGNVYKYRNTVEMVKDNFTIEVLTDTITLQTPPTFVYGTPATTANVNTVHTLTGGFIKDGERYYLASADNPADRIEFYLGGGGAANFYAGGQDEYDEFVATLDAGVNKIATVTLPLTENNGTAQFFLRQPSDITITADPFVISDAGKVALDKDALVISKVAFSEAEEIDLVDAGANGTTITWEVKASDPNAGLVDPTKLADTDAKLAVSLPAEEGEKEVVIVATITSGTVSETKEFTITIAKLASGEELPVTHTITFSSTGTAGNITTPADSDTPTLLSTLFKTGQAINGADEFEVYYIKNKGSSDMWVTNGAPSEARLYTSSGNAAGGNALQFTPKTAGNKIISVKVTWGSNGTLAIFDSANTKVSDLAKDTLKDGLDLDSIIIKNTSTAAGTNGRVDVTAIEIVTRAGSSTPPEPVSPVVSFESNDGTAVAPITAAPYNKPDDPTKTATTTESYAFAGWYLDEELEDAVDWATFAPEADTILYAKWTATPVTYTISFDVDGADAPIDSITHDAGEGLTITAPAEPTKAADGTNTYAFAGWYLDEECTTDVVDWTNIDLTGNITIYVKWEATPIEA